MKKVYISGRISGLDFNEAYRHFASAETWLIDQGHAPINPINLPRDMSYEEYMRLDILSLMSCDAIYMLDNYKASRGARLELSIAKAIGLEIVYEGDFHLDIVSCPDDPICWTHDMIIANLEEIKDHMNFEAEYEIRLVNDCISMSEAAKVKGQSMEDRLSMYREAIEKLGFERVLEA